MSFKGITGPGEYRTRDGCKATVTGVGSDVWYCWEGGISHFDAVFTACWPSFGFHAASIDDNPLDIIDYWKEEPVNKPNPKEIANVIAEFPKDCQDKVTKLVEKLGFEVEKKPEPKAGQVWSRPGLAGGVNHYLLYRHNDGYLRATSLDGESWLGTREVGCCYTVRELESSRCTFVADTLEDYYRNRKDKP